MSGRLIAEGAKWKKILTAHKQSLLQEIQDLEQLHKNLNDNKVKRELLGKCEALRELMDQEVKGAFRRTAKSQYEFGNRPGKILPGVIKPRRNLNYIAKMKDKKGEMKYSTRDISKFFFGVLSIIISSKYHSKL